MKNRTESLDILRGMAILGVILIHISSTAIDYSNGNDFFMILAITINQITRFAVPIFLIISGWGLAKSYKDGESYINFLKKRISKLLFLYVIWSIVYFAYSADTLNPIMLIKGIVIGNNFYHLYYIPLIILLYGLFPLFYKIGQTNIGLLACLLITIVSQVADLVTGIGVFNNPLNLFNWIFYFVLGIWMARNFQKKLDKLNVYKRSILFSVFVTACLVSVESNYLINIVGKGIATTSMRPTIILLSLSIAAFFYITTWKNSRFKRMTLILSQLSYGIYLSHALFLSLLENITKQMGFSLGTPYYMIISFVIVLLISSLVSIIINKSICVIQNFFATDRFNKKDVA